MSLTKVKKSTLEATLKGAVIPTSGTFSRGDVVFDSDVGVAPGNPTGWVCTVEGTPGTWEAFGARYLQVTQSADPSPIAAGAYESISVSVPGAVLGDFVEASFSLDLSGCSLSGYVSSAGNVVVIVRNNTGSIVNLGAGELTVRVNRK